MNISNTHRALLTRRVTLVGAATNTFLTIMQIIIGILGHSQALVADAMHTLSDLLSDGLAYWTARHSSSAPDSDHPYGHARFETAATLGIATLLTIVGIGIGWFAIERLFHANTIIIPNALTLYTAGITVLAKEGLYHYTVRMATQLQSDMLRASAWHHRSDAASSVVVFIAVAGSLFGWAYLDSLAAIVVGLMIINIGIDLGKRAIRELVDTGLSAAKIQTIRSTILTVDGVRDLHLLRTRQLGYMAIADVHILVEPYLSVSEGHQIGLEVELRLKQTVPELSDVTVHIDPENDEIITDCSGLPLRAEALNILNNAWKNIDGAQNYSKVVLHYLTGHIDIDVYYSLQQANDFAQTNNLIQELKAAIIPHQEFRTLKVYFGSS